jgi:hypothetical protein
MHGLLARKKSDDFDTFAKKKKKKDKGKKTRRMMKTFNKIKRKK